MSIRQALIIGGSRGIGFSVALKFAVIFKLLFLTFGQFFDN
jgi:NAD(P)-dependent dehydrogenase (short-subunit alcohol dehydrogenase family)